MQNFLLAAILPNGGIAILLSSLHNLFLMTYAGFFVNLDKIPPVLRWLRWFDVLGYALEAMVVNEVGAGLEIVDTLAGGEWRGLYRHGLRHLIRSWR
jgi:ABC-type multidrug transport system permease subunit